jgi:hypothetical protein
MTDEPDRSVSRRALLRRCVVVGGLAWTAPLIVESVVVPAGAQVSPGPPPDDRRRDDDDDDPKDSSAPRVAPASPAPAPPVISQATFTG